MKRLHPRPWRGSQEMPGLHGEQSSVRDRKALTVHGTGSVFLALTKVLRAGHSKSRHRRNGEAVMSGLQVVQRQYANHWPLWCVVDESGRVLLCRETEAEAGEMLAGMEKAKGTQGKEGQF